MSIIIDLNTEGDLPSQFTRMLWGRCIPLNAKIDDMHPYTKLLNNIRNASERAVELVEQLRELHNVVPIAKRFDPGGVPRALKAFIYAAAEAFDFYEKDIPRILEPARVGSEARLIGEYKKIVKRLRSPVGLMCNRMKHNGREIVMGRFISQADRAITFVYRINTAYGGVQRADTEVHREVGFSSVERTLHEIVHGLIRVDFHAGKLVTELSDNGNEAVNLKGISEFGLAKVFKYLAEFAPLVVPPEPRVFDGLAVGEGYIRLERIHAEAMRGVCEVTMLARVDEVARSIDVFR